MILKYGNQNIWQANKLLCNVKYRKYGNEKSHLKILIRFLQEIFVFWDYFINIRKHLGV